MRKERLMPLFLPVGKNLGSGAPKALAKLGDQWGKSSKKWRNAAFFTA